VVVDTTLLSLEWLSWFDGNSVMGYRCEDGCVDVVGADGCVRVERDGRISSRWVMI
jgi:hypothetical protein